MGRVRANPLLLIPPLLFAGLAALFFAGLGRDDANAPPTGRVGGPAPAFALLQLGPDAPFTRQALEGPGVRMVNFWASWCAPCRAEHPSLMGLAGEGVPIYGVNYRDDPAKALAFLEELGNPFAAVGADPDGRAAIEWGVSGVPETFILDGDGTILLRFAGPITRRSLEARIRPVLEGAGLAASGPVSE